MQFIAVGGIVGAPVLMEAAGTGAGAYLITNTPRALKYLFWVNNSSWLARGSIVVGDAGYQYYSRGSVNPIQAGAAGLLGPGSYSLAASYTDFTWGNITHGVNPISITNSFTVNQVLITTAFSIMGDKGGALFDEGGVAPAAGVLGVMASHTADKINGIGK
jgi:hypothetical protein